MSTKNKLFQRFFLVATSVLATSVLAISPSRAATFASSASEVDFENFSQAPSSFDTSTDTFSLINEKGGSAQAITEAVATFSVPSASASNSNLSEAFGENQAYLAIADSQSEIIGNFEIEAGTSFSFDFVANLNLQTSIDNPSSENATAIGDISFFLWDVDNQTVLDAFNLFGNLITASNNDFVDLEISENLNPIFQEVDENFSGLEESLAASVEGSYERFFVNETNLRLVEFKRNIVIVKAPEPSITLALLLSSGAIGVMLKRRRK